MASPTKMGVPIFLAFSLFFHDNLGAIICEELSKEMCVFSIASSGKRCLLENTRMKDGNVEYQCRTSEVVVERMGGWIESNECVEACGVDRNMVGISSDSLLEPQLTSKLCSPECSQNCPNIIDLYFNLAAGEGVFLADLCEAQSTNPHRSMIELLSSGVALGPTPSKSSSFVADAPSYF